METISLGNKLIGAGQPCFIIAEGCDNHLGDLSVAMEMIRQAKLSGADAIKFQHHLPDEEMLKDNVPMSTNFNIPLYEFLQKYALKLEGHEALKQYCDEIGIIYLCTPFSRKAALEINHLVPAFKIGSGELTDLPTLKVIARLEKPIILSSGMSIIDEIDETINTLMPLNSKLALMNCTSEYPPRYEDINLGMIAVLEKRYNIPIGHSDHTPDIYTCFGAVALGARLVEKHLILDKRQPGPDQSVSIEPYELYQLVQGIRKIESAMGNEKKVNELEKPIRSWAHRSIVTLKDIPQNTCLTEEYVWTKRPGTGIPAKHLDQFLGKTTNKELKKDQLITWDDVIG
jgi:sialic acid synthase SpsE